MALPSGESLLISALINNGDVEEAFKYGITPHHFRGWKDQYNWLLNYVKTYGEQPSRDAFKAEFPEFPWSDHYDVRSACDLVLKAFSRHQLTEAITEGMELMKVGDVHAAWSTITKAEPRTTSAKPRRLLTDMTFFDTWEKDKGGVHVPYTILQKYTGGIKPGNLWYLAARPGNGKTAHLCNIVTRAVLDGARVKFYSLEMSEMEVRGRFHAALASHYGVEGITLNAIRDRTVDMYVYKEFIGELDDRLEGVLDIHTPKDGFVTPATVASCAEDYELNVIDYIGLMRAEDGTPGIKDWRIAAEISNRLKEIGLSSSTGILAAAQINREGDSGANPPKLSNLAQSDALGQDADVLVTLRKAPHDVASLFSLEKNRHGQSSISFATTFDPNTGVYRSIDRDEVEGLVSDFEMQQ